MDMERAKICKHMDMDMEIRKHSASTKAHIETQLKASSTRSSSSSRSGIVETMDFRHKYDVSAKDEPVHECFLFVLDFMKSSC